MFEFRTAVSFIRGQFLSQSDPDLSWRLGVRKSFLSTSMKIEALGERATDEELTSIGDGLALGWVKGGHTFYRRPDR